MSEHLLYPLVATCLFVLLSHKISYKISNNYYGIEGDCPNYKSHLTHTLIFFILLMIVLFLIGKLSLKAFNFELILKYALHTSLIYFFLSSIELYELSNNITGMTLHAGCPTMHGILIHSLLFFLIKYVN